MRRRSDNLLKTADSVGPDAGDITTLSRKQLLLESELSIKMLEKKIGVNFDEVLANMKMNRRHSKIMLFFHGNAEDIGIARSALITMRQNLRVSEIIYD